jgi:hypothetical protein
MGTSLNGLTPAGTYPGLIKTGDNAPIDGTLKTLSDGNGNNLPMAVSTTAVNFTGTLTQGGTTLQPTLVSGTNIKTINSTSLLGSGNIDVVTSPSGVAGAIQFSNGSAFASDATNLFWDDTNNQLGIGTNAPNAATTINTNGAWAQGFSNNLRLNAPSPSLQLKTTLGNDGFMIGTSGPDTIFASSTASDFSTLTYNAVLNSGNWGFGGYFSPSARMHIKGSGSTSATTSLLVQNSAGTQLFKVADDGRADFGGTLFGVNGVFSANLNFQSILYGTNFWSQDDGGTTIGAQAAPVASAILDIRSTTRGFLPPRMTTTQKNAIASPATGLVVYDSTTNKLCCYNGSTWNDLF